MLFIRGVALIGHPHGNNSAGVVGVEQSIRHFLIVTFLNLCNCLLWGGSYLQLDNN